MTERKQIKILTVDDLELTRKMLRSVLGEAGYSQVDEAGDGADALRKIMTAEMSGSPYHIVFCDWNMPGMPGIEVLRTVRSNPKFAKLPFVMVTAESDRKEVMTAVAAGASDYVIKPIKVDAILKKMERLFGTRAA